VIIILTTGYHDSFIGSKEIPLTEMVREGVALVMETKHLRILFWHLFSSSRLEPGEHVHSNCHHNIVSWSSTGNNRWYRHWRRRSVNALCSVLLSDRSPIGSDIGKHLLSRASIEAILWPLPALTRRSCLVYHYLSTLAGLAAGVFSISFGCFLHRCEAKCAAE